MPEGGARTVTDPNPGEGAVSGKLLGNQPLKKGLISRSFMARVPSFPGKRMRLMKLVREFHKQAMILVFKVFDPQPSTAFGCAEFLPTQQALRTIAFVLSSPEEGY
jgi:hypothetical protein